MPAQQSTDPIKLEKYQKYLKELEDTYNSIRAKENEMLSLENERADTQKELGKLLELEVELVKKGISRRTKVYQNLLKERKLNEDNLELTKDRLKLLEDELDLEKQSIDNKKENAKLEEEAYKYAVERERKTRKIFELGRELLKQTVSIAKYTIEQDGAIKQTQLSMGNLTQNANEFYNTIVKTSSETALIGMQVKDLALIQGKYSEGLGRSVTLGEKGLKSISLIAKGTTLGSEGATDLAIAMDQFGINAQRSADYVQNVLDMSHDMGVNASVSVNNIVKSLKLAQKYNFKEGVKGAQQMAIAASKYKLDMEAVGGMAEKLFDIQGAIDMSAQLQVLGGEWSKMADPFKLMYQARNDMNGLYDSVVNATAGVAQFNKETGSFDVSPLEQHRIRKIAEQIGIPFENLLSTSRELAKFNQIKLNIASNITNKKDQELLTSLAQFNSKSGKWEVDFGNGPKEVSQITSNMIQVYDNQKATLEANAKNAQTLTDSWNNTILAFKSSIMPVIKPILDVLQSALVGVGKLFSEFSSTGKAIAGGLTLITGFVVKQLFNNIQWYNNGKTLAQGFNSYMSTNGDVGGNGGGIGGKTIMGGKFGKKAAMMGKGAGVAGLGLSVASMFTEKGSGADKALAIGGGALNTGIIGAELGTLIAPGIGTIIGGALGAIAGGIMGAYESGALGNEQQDYIMRPGQSAVPFSSKDTVMGFKPGGAVEQAILSNTNGSKMSSYVAPNYSNNIGNNNFNPQNSNSNIKFSDLNVNFKGKIELSSGNGNNSLDITSLLLDPTIKRELAKMVQEELRKSLGGGKLNASISN